MSGAVNSCINHSFLHLYLQFYYVSVRSTWYDVRGPHNFRGAPVAQQPLPSLVLKSVVTATYYSNVQTVRTVQAMSSALFRKI